MKVLIVCATAHEARALYDVPPVFTEGQCIDAGNGRTLLITGVGQYKTTWHLGRHLLQNRYDLAINAGICGAFNSHIKITEVVSVTKDCFADLGAEDDETFLDIFDIGLEERNNFPFNDGWLHPLPFEGAFNRLPKVSGITVNRSSGSVVTIEKLSQKYHADVESLEGAAFFFACLNHKLPAIQVRAVSNVIEKRNRKAWKIQEALNNLAFVYKNEISRV